VELTAAVATVIAAAASLISIILAIRAISETHTTRKAAARDRDRRRLEMVSVQLDAMHATALADKAYLPHREDWRTGCGYLQRYLAATSIELPWTRAVISAPSPQHAINAIEQARAEILDALMDLADLDQAADEPVRFWPPVIALFKRRPKLNGVRSTSSPQPQEMPDAAATSMSPHGP